MGATNEPPSRRPFLIRPEEGETAEHFADRLIALMGLEDEPDEVTADAGGREPIEEARRIGADYLVSAGVPRTWALQAFTYDGGHVFVMTGRGYSELDNFFLVVPDDGHPTVSQVPGDWRDSLKEVDGYAESGPK